MQPIPPLTVRRLIKFMNRVVVLELLELFQIVPPQRQSSRLEDELEPRRQRRVQRSDLLVEVAALEPPDLAHLAEIRL